MIVACELVDGVRITFERTRGDRYVCNSVHTPYYLKKRMNICYK